MCSGVFFLGRQGEAKCEYGIVLSSVGGILSCIIHAMLR